MDTSASRVMRKRAVASTSPPGKAAPTLAAITSSSRARHTPCADRQAIQPRQLVGHRQRRRSALRRGRGQHGGHVPLQARQLRRRLQLLHGQRREHRQDFLGEMRLQELPLLGRPVGRLAAPSGLPRPAARAPSRTPSACSWTMRCTRSADGRQLRRRASCRPDRGGGPRRRGPASARPRAPGRTRRGSS